jgi:hypothetical protein
MNNPATIVGLKYATACNRERLFAIKFDIRGKLQVVNFGVRISAHHDVLTA